MRHVDNIVILTGAGISAESGLATFRAEDGLWCGHRVEEVATPEGFARNPALVHAFYNTRRAQLKEVVPNAAHHALARLCKEWRGEVLIVTQNVDDLHDRALVEAGLSPAKHLIHMHGELTKARCLQSDAVEDCFDDLPTDGHLRPHIVWFGEMPFDLPRISRAIENADMFVSIGTSGAVYPAAGYVQEARYYGAHTIELNLEPSQTQSMFAEKRYGRASALVPEFVNGLLD